MAKRTLVLQVDDFTVEALRMVAARRGLICKRGPGAPLARGNISGLVMRLAREGFEALSQ